MEHQDRAAFAGWGKGEKAVGLKRLHTYFLSRQKERRAHTLGAA
jgi:hypothetical protein